MADIVPGPVAAPAAPAPPPQPPRPTAPVYVTPPPPPAPASTPTSSVSFQPTASRAATELVERIDETPQQNSKDIEGLIAHQHNLKRLKGFVSMLLFVAGVVVAAFLINQYIFQSYYVDGTSMTPNLQNDDRLIIDKVEKTWANLQGRPYIPTRGQIVVLDSSIIGVGGREEQLIKRVIGLPGDVVHIENGVVTVKNKQRPEGFNIDKELGINVQPTFVASTLEVTVPDNHVFVMGDNRVENGSYDSRAFGPIESSKLVGRLWARILPLDKAQIY
jgi:signal peptidase I